MSRYPIGLSLASILAVFLLTGCNARLPANQLRPSAGARPRIFPISINFTPRIAPAVMGLKVSSVQQSRLMTRSTSHSYRTTHYARSLQMAVPARTCLPTLSTLAAASQTRRLGS